MVRVYLSEIDGPETQKRFEELYHHYEQKMFVVAYGILHNVEDAEDAVHDAFETVIKKLDVIQDVYSDDTWGYLLVIVKHKAIRIYNKNKDRKDVLTGDFNLLEELAAEIEGIEAEIEKKELSDIVAHLVLELPERCRMILYLHYYKEMTYAQIGKILSMTESNARQIARRGRKLLEEKIVEKGVQYE